MTEYRTYCVVDAKGYYITLVNATVEISESKKEEVIHVEYREMQAGESLVLRTDECRQPTLKPYAGAAGFVKSMWDGTAWVEAATAAEIAAWEKAHPAPPVPPPTENERLRADVDFLAAMGGVTL